MTADARGPAARRGRHHIADVAHHFLGAAPGDEPAGPPAVVVAAAEPLAATAFVAAAAARTGAVAAGRNWALLEDDGAAGGAAGLLDGDDRVRPVATAAFAPGEAAGGLCWHLGVARPDRLDAWCNAARLPGCAPPTAGRAPHLFWCVPAEATGAVTPLALLARLAALVAPARVDLVVAPRRWPARGAAAPPDERALGRLRRRAAEICDRPVRVGVVTPGMGTAAAAALVTEFLHGAAAAGA